MKKVILQIIIAAILFTPAVLYSQSRYEVQSGAGVEVQSGADICADSIISNGFWTGGGTICSGASMRLKLSALIEGFYNPGINKMIRDTVMVYVRVSTPAPYTLVDSQKVVLDSLGNVTINFSNVSAGSYYIVIKHRNSIETWSKSGGTTLAIGSLNIYDFTLSQLQAYGNNLVLKGTKYCIYSGDVNHDGVVDGTDLSNIDNDASNFISGYVVTDVNGDQVIDGSDLAIDDNNASGFVSVIKPPGAPDNITKHPNNTRKNTGETNNNSNSEKNNINEKGKDKMNIKQDNNTMKGEGK